MTLFNYIGIGITILIFLVGILLKIYAKKRLNEVDGFVGVAPVGRKKGMQDDLK